MKPTLERATVLRVLADFERKARTELAQQWKLPDPDPGAAAFNRGHSNGTLWTVEAIRNVLGLSDGEGGS